jgi:hypothetical protein
MLATTELLARLTGRSFTAHIIRGVIGIGIFAVGASQAAERPYLGLFLMLLALIPIGGCPACWLGGLIEGACEVRPRPKQPPQ